jgi:hypothetical protein
MRNAKWAILAIGVCGAISARVWADGLSGLDGELSGTGRIGTFVPHQTRIAPSSPDGGVATSARDPVSSLARINADAERATHASDGGNEVQRTDSAVAACRIEVARRRHIPPSKVAADEVVVRFTIEHSGRVRDAEALSATGTDLEVAACAKRVLTEWVFAKRGTEQTVVERTYRFR